ncbi:hypothetical protein ABVT39_026918 [Epinephelus coioides]
MVYLYHTLEYRQRVGKEQINTQMLQNLEELGGAAGPDNRDMKKRKDSSRFFASEHQLLLAFNRLVHRFHHSPPPNLGSPLQASCYRHHTGIQRPQWVLQLLCQPPHHHHQVYK